MKQKREVQQETPALMMLKTLQVLGPLHGYGIARRIAQISGQLLPVSQGTLYPVLPRLEQECAVAPEWGRSEKQRARPLLPAHARRGKAARNRSAIGSRQRRLLRFLEVKAEDLA